MIESKKNQGVTGTALIATVMARPVVIVALIVCITGGATALLSHVLKGPIDPATFETPEMQEVAAKQAEIDKLPPAEKAAAERVPAY